MLFLIKQLKKGISKKQKEITELKKQLHNALDLKNYYETELNKLGIFAPQIAKIPLPHETIKKLNLFVTEHNQKLKNKVERPKRKAWKMINVNL